MATAKQERFEEFRDDANHNSPFSHMARGVGILDQVATPEDKHADIAAGIIAKIRGSIPEMGDGSLITLREILKAEISKILPKNERLMSMLDMVTHGVVTPEEINKFLTTHGINVHDKKDLAYLIEVLTTAIEYYDTHIVTKKSGSPLHKDLGNVNSLEDVYTIFTAAAGHNHRSLIPQACGILRIAAAIDFIKRDPILALLPEAEKALLKIKEDYFPMDNSGKRILTTRRPGEMPIAELNSVEFRTKLFEAIITKLLHKPSNDTQEILDHIGFKIETNSRADIIKVIYHIFFRPDTAIMPKLTIRIKDGKQLMLDEAAILAALRDPRKARSIVDKLSIDTTDDDELTTIASGNGSENDNTSSSKKYKAIHVVCEFQFTTSDGRRVSFPVEWQFVDKKSRQDNDKEASHPEYRARQLVEVRERLLGDNLSTRFEDAEKARKKH